MNKNSLLRAALVILIPLIVYLATVPGNQTEAEDAFWFASVAENSEADWIHLHHMLYFPSIKLFNGVIVFFGFSGRSYGALVVLHIFIGALTAFLLYIFLHERLKVESIASFIGASLLAFSYGFWRYSAEVEIPVWISLTSLVLLYLGFCDKYTLPRAFGLGVIAAFAILFHGLNALLACTIIPLRLFVRSTIWFPIVYAIGAALILFSVYGTAFLINEKLPIQGVLNRGTILDPIYLLKGVIGFGQATISGNFLWGSTWLAERLESLFVSNTMTEEIYMGASAPKWLFYASIVSLSFMCISFLWLIISRFKCVYKRDGNSDVIYIIIWCSIYVIFLFWFEGGNPELPIPALVPIWTLVTVFIIDVVCRNGKKLPCISFAIFFFLHNLIGGMAWIWSADSDYYRARSAWLLENVSSNDLIITGDKKPFTRYLQYWSESEIVNVYNISDEEFRAVEDKIKKWEGEVYVLEEIFNRPAYLCFQSPGFCDRLSVFAAGLETDVEEIAKSGPSTVFQVK